MTDEDTQEGAQESALRCTQHSAAHPQGLLLILPEVSNWKETQGARLTWREVLAMPRRIHQDVGVEGGVKPLISATNRRRVL